MAPNEEWVKQFQALTGRAPTVEEYQQGKASGFALDQLAAIAGGQATQVPQATPDAATTPQPAHAKRAKSRKPWPLWLKVGSGLVGAAVVIGIIWVAVVATSGSNKAPTVKPVASSKAAKASASSVQTPTHDPTTEQQLGLVLLTSGASRYSPSGQAIVDGSLPAQATHDDTLVTDAPDGSRTYAMWHASNADDNTQAYPVIVIDADTAYLGKATGPVSFADLKQDALTVNLTSQWRELWQSSDLAKLVKQLSIVEASSDATSSSTSQSSQDDAISGDLDTAWQQVSGRFIEDDSTVSDGAPQLSEVNRQDGQWQWIAYHYGDGAPKYEYDVSGLHPAGGDGKGGQIFAGKAVSPFDSSNIIDITFDLIDANTYTIRSKNINYYGKFNRQ
ncbi:hypothetical protein [Lacticaseibacillus jixiensis]|uniref:hypothetical protein n=1 Tax=Lacticaseibacillus jixiensis TaxID=3231926 RepID=UPI0036F22300